MIKKMKYILMAIFCVIALLATGCTTAKTITQTVGQVTQTQWVAATTVTQPGSTSTITQPAVTITLPAVTNTIVQPAVTDTVTSTVTQPPVTITQPAVTITNTVTVTPTATIPPIPSNYITTNMAAIYVSSGTITGSAVGLKISAADTYTIVYNVQYNNPSVYNFNSVNFKLNFNTDIPLTDAAKVVSNLATSGNAIIWYGAQSVGGGVYQYTGLPSITIPANTAGNFNVTMTIKFLAPLPAIDTQYFLLATPVIS